MKKYKLIWQALEKIEFGSIEITFLNQEKKIFTGKKSGPKADLIIKDKLALNSVITGGDVAFGEGYMSGYWDSKDLCSLMYFLTLNSESLEKFFHANKFQALILYFKTIFNKNTKVGSKKNISLHYDLGNDFYELWLDKTMTYSSALFLDQNISFAEAQEQKYQNIISKLSGKSILEIGCGWGAFSKKAFENNFEVTCLTLSKKQREYALKLFENVTSSGLKKPEIYLRDYRDENNKYDNIVSIEMFEAVGKEYWNKYFEILKKSLKEDSGKAILQIITIDENVFEDYKNRVDFIQKHIFPGGVLPSKAVIHRLAEKHGLSVKSEEAFGLDYAKTLEIWLDNFDKKREEVLKLGFDEEFIKKWRFYLAYCYGGFSAKRTDVVQFELEHSKLR